MDSCTWMLSDTGQCGRAFLGVLCCSALVTSVLELVAAVTAVSSESHPVQNEQTPKAQHGREVPGIIADARLDSESSLKDFGVIGNAGLAVASLTLAAWPLFPGTVFAERSGHNLTAPPHVFLHGPGVSSGAHSPMASRETIHQQKQLKKMLWAARTKHRQQRWVQSCCSWFEAAFSWRGQQEMK